MTRLILALCALALATAASAASAEETITGKPIALDAYTLRFVQPDGKPVDVRLWGIDAPEMSAENGHGWAARAKTDALLAGQPAVCTVIDTDKYKRPVAICTGENQGPDLGWLMIRDGWAVEYRKYTQPAPDGLAETVRIYAAAEATAIKHRRGRWKHILRE